MVANIKVLLEALKHIGIREFSGKHSSSPTILFWLRQLIPYAKEDEINWCSAFAANVVKTALQLEHIPVDASARSWLRYGYPTDKPEMGDMVIFWRNSPESWEGHIAIYIRENSRYVWVLGGNQSNAVSIAPYEKSRVLGYRKHELVDTTTTEPV